VIAKIFLPLCLRSVVALAIIVVRTCEESVRFGDCRRERFRAQETSIGTCVLRLAGCPACILSDFCAPRRESELSQ